MSTQDDESWRWVAEFVADRPAILFFNSDAEKAMFTLGSGSALVAILAEIYYDEFYVTDEDADYLFCYNHHDILLASGTAKAWLAACREQKAGA